MLVYLDMCCLKRPFDDQSQPRIRLESEAVLGLLAAEPEKIRLVRSPALDFENAQNPVKARALRAEHWLKTAHAWEPDADKLETRTAELMDLGFRNFDALHIAGAEQAGAEAFGSCDDQLLAVARRYPERLKVRVLGIVELAHEVLK
jgi:hypothetical protein